MTTQIGAIIETALYSVVTWPEGGRSIYFRDLDEHLIELKTSSGYGKALG